VQVLTSITVSHLVSIRSRFACKKHTARDRQPDQILVGTTCSAVVTELMGCDPNLVLVGFVLQTCVSGAHQEFCKRSASLPYGFMELSSQQQIMSSVISLEQVFTLSNAVIQCCVTLHRLSTVRSQPSDRCCSISATSWLVALDRILSQSCMMVRRRR